MSVFEKLTLVCLASTEQSSLVRTLELLSDNCPPEDIEEAVVFLLSDTCPSAPTARELERTQPFRFPVRVELQQTKGLSNAIFEIPQYVNSSHFLIIASDLEMDPLSVPDLIKIAKSRPDAIVCASKFKKGAKRSSYGFLHLVCNRAVNLAVELLLGRRGTELISTFQIYPTALCREMGFDDPERAICEFTFRPLARGAEYIEIPSDYVRRSDGESNYKLRNYVDLGLTCVKSAVAERRSAGRQPFAR